MPHQFADLAADQLAGETIRPLVGVVHGTVAPEAGSSAAERAAGWFRTTDVDAQVSAGGELSAVRPIERTGARLIPTGIHNVSGRGLLYANRPMMAMLTVRNRSRVANLAGILEFAGPFCTVGEFCSFVGNTGPKHLVAGLGSPYTGIHSGNVVPREWDPWGTCSRPIAPHALLVMPFLRAPGGRPNPRLFSRIRPVDVYRVCKSFLAMRFARNRTSGTKAFDRGNSPQHGRLEVLAQ